jgi:hypothetical protein
VKPNNNKLPFAGKYGLNIELIDTGREPDFLHSDLETPNASYQSRILLWAY